MKLENKVVNQMVSHLFFLRNSKSWIVFLAPIPIILVGILGFGFISIFLASSLLIFSTIFFIFSEHKLDQKIPPHFGDVRKSKEQVNMNQIHDSPNIVISENEEGLDYSLSTSDELDSEVDWRFGDSISGRSPEFSDISDEDSLIEIALTSGQYVGHKEEETAGFNKLHKKIPDLFADSILKQHNLLEFLATDFNEMNEEDNLIEIDISIGSIKCPRFEIQA